MNSSEKDYTFYNFLISNSLIYVVIHLSIKKIKFYLYETLMSNWSQMVHILNFLRTVSVHFGSPSQNVLKLILKSPRIVPFGALTYLWADSETAGDPDRSKGINHVLAADDQMMLPKLISLNLLHVLKN